MAGFMRAPALLFDPADRRIISIIGVVEKVQLLQPVEDGFDLQRISVRGEFVSQSVLAVCTLGKQCAGPVHEVA